MGKTRRVVVGWTLPGFVVLLRRFGLGLALLGMTACATGNDHKDVACAASLLFVEAVEGVGSTAGIEQGAVGRSAVGGAVDPRARGYDLGASVDAAAHGLVQLDGQLLDFNRLDSLQAQGCEPAKMLEAFNSVDETSRVQIADALIAVGQVELAVAWYEKADSPEAYERLLKLHGSAGPLADDAQYLRYEVQRAQLQQAFGQQVDWPAVGHAQPLFVQSGRSALYQDTDLDSQVLEALDDDEQVYLLDVVMLEGTESYWVQAYYPPTLTLGWIPAEDMAQYPRRVRGALAELDDAAGRNYAQQLMFTALLHGMDRSGLVALSENDFFSGAAHQQQNSVAIIRRLGEVADACMVESADLEQMYARHLMGEGSEPQAADASYAFAMREALAALTGRAAPGLGVDETLAEQLSEQAYRYLRIRSFAQVEQRLCHSLPNAAGSPEYAETTCEALAALQSCINRVDAILTAR